MHMSTAPPPDSVGPWALLHLSAAAVFSCKDGDRYCNSSLHRDMTLPLRLAPFPLRTAPPCCAVGYMRCNGLH